MNTILFNAHLFSPSLAEEYQQTEDMKSESSDTGSNRIPHGTIIMV